MKKINRLLVLICLIALILFSGSVIAQKGSVNTASTIWLQVGNNSIPVDNLSFTDALGTNNQMQHTASFDILLTNDEATRGVIGSLQVFDKERTGRQVTFTTVNTTGESTGERVYDNTLVDEISFPALDGTSRNALKATIKFTAGAVKLQKGSGKKGVFTKKQSVAIVSNFSLRLGSLPTNRVTKISGLSIKPGSQQLLNFTIEISAVDGAAWNQWFLTGGGGARKEQGSISLLSPNMKDILYSFSLMDVEIVSYSGGSGNQQTLSRATIGLRMKTMAIK